MVYRASSMVGVSVLTTAEGLVNTIPFVPIVILPEKVVAGRVVGVTVNQVLYLLYRASSMVGLSVLTTDEVLVNTTLLVPRVTFPEKVVAGRVVGVTVNQVLYLVYRASRMVGVRILTTELVNFKLLVPISIFAAERMMSPVKVAPALRAYGERSVVLA